jgi:hypothetical protein
VITDSRVKLGKLELSTDGLAYTAYSCQPTSVVVEPSYKDSGDPVEVLCGESSAPSTTMTWAFKITAIQDFDNKLGLMAFLRDNALDTVHFRFTPNTTAQIVSGTMQARPGPWYGEIGVRNTTDIEMPINGDPAWADQPPAA